MYERTMKYDARLDTVGLVAHIASRLRGVEARDVRVIGNRVLFKGGIFRWVSNTNVLVPFGHGEIEVDKQNHAIHYRLSYRQLLITTTAITGGIAVVFLSFALALSVFDPKMLLVVLLMWVWTVGGNLLIGLPRFKVFVRKAVETAPVGSSVGGYHS
jgi:hypothetical protein